MIQSLLDSEIKAKVYDGGRITPEEAKQLYFAPLTELKTGQTGVIRRVSDWQSTLLAYLHERGITVSQRKMPMERASAESAPNAATVAPSGWFSPPKVRAARPIITGATRMEYSRYTA